MSRPCGMRKSKRYPDAFNKTELMQLARQHTLKGRSKMTLLQLCHALQSIGVDMTIHEINPKPLADTDKLAKLVQKLKGQLGEDLTLEEFLKVVKKAKPIVEALAIDHPEIKTQFNEFVKNARNVAKISKPQTQTNKLLKLVQKLKGRLNQDMTLEEFLKVVKKSKPLVKAMAAEHPEIKAQFHEFVKQTKKTVKHTKKSEKKPKPPADAAELLKLVQKLKKRLGKDMTLEEFLKVVKRSRPLVKAMAAQHPELKQQFDQFVKQSRRIAKQQRLAVV